ncbi:MAG: 2-dehydro-3-deoxy-6-phosphogalactonate aldolase, partial [Aestuariivirga sp.]
DQAVAQCGIIAILRGVTPHEVLDVTAALFEAGIRIVEVPLNSPEPFTSIEMLAKKYENTMVVGAGTVLSAQDVQMLKNHGGQISVSPDCNEDVIARAVALGLEPLPGVFTPTEAFAAIRAGAKNLKLFPAECASPATIKAWKAVLPKHVQIHAVGGVTPDNMAQWLAAGAGGFGIGSSLYKPGAKLETVSQSAQQLVAAWKKAKQI